MSNSLARDCLAFFRFIVTGDGDGKIKFYDKTMRLLYWSQNFVLPSVCSISFDLNPRLYEIRDPTNFNAGTTVVGALLEINLRFLLDETLFTLDGYEDRSAEYEILYKNMVPCDFSIEKKPFICRDFIVCRSSKCGKSF